MAIYIKDEHFKYFPLNGRDDDDDDTLLFYNFIYIFLELCSCFQNK